MLQAGHIPKPPEHDKAVLLYEMIQPLVSMYPGDFKVMQTQ